MIEYLCNLPVVEKSRREEGYIISSLSFDEGFIRGELNLNEKYVEVQHVYVPAKREVKKHLHNKGWEYFIPESTLELELNDRVFSTSKMVAVRPRQSHAIKGEQEFYLVKAYDEFFDKVMA